MKQFLDKMLMVYIDFTERLFARLSKHHKPTDNSDDYIGGFWLGGDLTGDSCGDIGGDGDCGGDF